MEIQPVYQSERMFIGIIIYDAETRCNSNFLTVSLSDITSEILDGNKYFWDILWIYDDFSNENNKLQDEIEKSISGINLSWDMLLKLSKNFVSLVDIEIIANKDPKKNIKYKSDQSMYENCDIVIQLIDSSYWIVTSKDEDLIERLSKKFKNVKPLEKSLEIED